MTVTVNNKEPEKKRKGEPQEPSCLVTLLSLLGGIGLVVFFYYFFIFILAASEPWQR